MGRNSPDQSLSSARRMKFDKGKVIMKISSKSFFVMSALWIIVSLIAFFWSENIILGIVWLCAGIMGFIIALISKKKEQK